MKLTKEQALTYKCDFCHSFRKFKDMHSDSICLDCCSADCSCEALREKDEKVR